MKNRVVFPTSRSQIIFVEMSRVYVSGMRVVYSSPDDHGVMNTYNIPDLNTSILILGTGCSITQQAIRMLRESDVIVMFSGSGGFPLYYADMMYKPTEYVQTYIKKWYSEEYRIRAGRYMQKKRLDNVLELWPLSEDDKKHIEQVHSRFDKAENIKTMMGIEGDTARRFFFPTAARLFNAEWIGRNRDNKSDEVNQRLNRANVIVYGMTMVALTGLGIPPAFAISHGMSRRGGLVYDVADMYKDAVTLPICMSSKYSHDSSEFKIEIIHELHNTILGHKKLLSRMFTDIKDIVNL